MGAARRAHHAAEKAKRVIGSKRAEEAMMKRRGKKLIKAAEEQFYQPEISYLKTLGDTEFGIRRAQAPKSPALGLKIALGGKPQAPEGVNVLKPGEYVKAELPPGITEEEAKAKLLAKLKKPTKEEEAYLKSIKEAHYKNIAALNNLEYEPTSAVDNKSKLAGFDLSGLLDTPEQQTFAPLTGKALEDAKIAQYKNFAKFNNLEYEPSSYKDNKAKLQNFDLSGLLNTPNQSLDPNQIDFSTLVGLNEPTVDPIPLPSSITDGELNTMLSTLTGQSQPKSDYDILINKLTS